MDYTSYERAYYTSLKFLEDRDSPFPNRNAKNAYSRMKHNLKLLNGTYNDNVNITFWQNGVECQTPYQKVTLNYFKPAIDKADSLIFNKTPVVKTGNKETDRQVNKIIQQTNFFDSVRHAFRIAQVYGSVPIRISRRGLSIIPYNCIPVVNPHDISDIQHYICYELLYNSEGIAEFIRLEIHSPFEVFEQVRNYSSGILTGGVLGDPVDYEYRGRKIPKSGSRYPTNCPMHCCTNFVFNAESDPIWGKSIFSSFEQIVLLVEHLTSTSAKVIDSNSKPMLTVDISQTYVSERSGERNIKLATNKDGKEFLVTAPGSNDPKYLEVQGSLDRSENLRQELLDHLYTLSALGKAYWTNSFSGNISTDSINALISSAISKCEMDANQIWFKARDALYVLCCLNGIELEIEDINIVFTIGKAMSQKETAEVVCKLDSAQILSKKTLLEKFFDMDEDSSMLELQTIIQERESSNPIIQHNQQSNSPPQQSNNGEDSGDEIGGQNEAK